MKNTEEISFQQNDSIEDEYKLLIQNDHLDGRARLSQEQISQITKSETVLPAFGEIPETVERAPNLDWLADAGALVKEKEVVDEYT